MPGLLAKHTLSLLLASQCYNIYVCYGVSLFFIYLYVYF